MGGALWDNEISAVVVSYNTRELTVRCVQCLFSCGSVREVCVVDNASCDGTVEALGALPVPEGTGLRVTRLRENVGFGRANNLGFEEVRGGYIALVNSDAFVSAGALDGLRSYLQAHPEAGVVGPCLFNADGTFQESRFAFPSPARAWAENTGALALLEWAGLVGTKDRRCAGKVDWLGGACLMVRREVWADTGGFDSSFFLYSEETDWQRRIHNQEWEIHWVPKVAVTHLGGGSGLGKREAVREHFFEGVDRYFWKHHGRFGVVSLRCAMVLGAALRWIREVLKPNGQPLVPAWILRRQMTRALPRFPGAGLD